MTTTPHKPKRRWLRFSLRSLFVLVTVIACWLGWQVHVVQHRKAMLKQIEAEGGRADYMQPIDWLPWHVAQVRPANDTYKISNIRKLLGDQQMSLIEFDRHLTAADRRAIEAFPEARVNAIP